jgi:integrase
MVFRRGNADARRAWYMWLPLGAGVRWSTGTDDKKRAQQIERAMRDLVDRKDFQILHAIRDGRLTIDEVFEAHRRRAIEELRRALDDSNLEPLVAGFLEVHGAKVKPDTVAHYKFVLEKLMPAASLFPTSRFCVKELEPWIARYPGKNGTRRKAHAALSVFAAYLVRQGVLTHNPMRQFSAPRADPPRLNYLEVERMIVFTDALPEPYQTLSAVLHGTGIEIGTALELVAGDVDLLRKEIRARGTKTHSRDRTVRVAEWAWPYVVARVAGLEQHERLFDTDRWRVENRWKDACKTLKLENYTRHDARHSYAVRAIRAGTPAELVARQLGHADAVLVLKVYGRFAPSQQDRDLWELRAAALDEARWAELAERSTTPNATPPEASTREDEIAKSPNPLGLDDFESSRGGTRTRDPGIMSAVL